MTRIILISMVPTVALLALILASCGGSSQGRVEHRYGTWDNMEVDKCASAWLLKQYVDTLAEYVFVPVGQIITEAIPFDTPDAELRRTGRHSAFWHIVDSFKLDDPGLRQLAEVIDELEVRSWETTNQHKGPNALVLDSLIRSVIASATGLDDCFELCYVVMDSLYEEMSSLSDTSVDGSNK